MARGDEEVYKISGQREHEATIRASRDGLVKLCWRKLDRKSKKLNFSFQVSDQNSNNLAGQDTLALLNQELSSI